MYITTPATPAEIAAAVIAARRSVARLGSSGLLLLSSGLKKWAVIRATAARDLDPVIAQYHAEHERTYGVRFDVPVELVAVRVVATGRTPGLREAPPEAASGPSLKGTRPCFFAGAWHETALHDRARLAPGAVIEGPAIIDQYDTTTVVLPKHRLEVDAFGNLLIWPATETV